MHKTTEIKAITIAELDSLCGYFALCVFIPSGMIQYGGYLTGVGDLPDFSTEPVTLEQWIMFILLILSGLLLFSKRVIISSSTITVKQIFGLFRRTYFLDELHFGTCIQQDDLNSETEPTYDIIYLAPKRPKKLRFLTIARYGVAIDFSPALYNVIKQLTPEIAWDDLTFKKSDISKDICKNLSPRRNRIEHHCIYCSFCLLCTFCAVLNLLVENVFLCLFLIVVICVGTIVFVAKFRPYAIELEKSYYELYLRQLKDN